MDGNFSMCVISYNLRGFCKLEQDFCNQLTSINMVGNSLPILCNQENFIINSNSYRINNALPGFHTVIKPAVKNNFDNGRPSNGMFIAVPNKNQNFDDSELLETLNHIRTSTNVCRRLRRCIPLHLFFRDISFNCLPFYKELRSSYIFEKMRSSSFFEKMRSSSIFVKFGQSSI